MTNRISSVRVVLCQFPRRKAQFNAAIPRSLLCCAIAFKSCVSRFQNACLKSAVQKHSIQSAAPVAPQFESGHNWSDCLGQLAQPTSEGLFVKRYRRLLERVTEELDRQTIRNLLAEELQKQRDAGDPI